MSCKISTLNSCFLTEENERVINVVFSGVDISSDSFLYKITSSYSGKEYASIVPTHDATTVTLNIPDDLAAQVYKHELTWTKDGKTRVVFQGFLTISKDSKDCNCPDSGTFQIVDETITVDVSYNENITQNTYNNNYNVAGKGEYVEGVYNAGNVVTLNNSSYLSKIDNNTDAPLNADGSLNAGWQLIAQGISDEDLQNLINATTAANAAATNAASATTSAASATSAANNAAASATNAATAANEATTAANEAASKADTATTAANEATTAANEAADNANQVATAANEAASKADTATTAANEAADNANQVAADLTTAKNNGEFNGTTIQNQYDGTALKVWFSPIADLPTDRQDNVLYFGY